MTTLTKSFLLLGFLTLNSHAMDEKTFTKQAGQRAETFMKALKSELQKSVKMGVPEGIGHCKIEAPIVTAKSNEGKWSLGRTSHKVRNQNNTPKKWMLTYLDEYRKSKKQEASVVKMGENHYVLLKPLYVAGLCLNCHGSAIPKKVQSVIKKDYPEDQAHGFKAGDFRGFVWVEYKE